MLQASSWHVRSACRSLHDVANARQLHSGTTSAADDCISVHALQPFTHPTAMQTAASTSAAQGHQLPCRRFLRRQVRTVRCRAQPASAPAAEDWRSKARPIKPGSSYPAKEFCSHCGLCDTYYVAHVKDACAFLGDGEQRWQDNWRDSL